MKPKKTLARAALATAFMLTRIPFPPGVARAQEEMKDMPGMAQKTTPKPKKSAPAATTLKPAAAAMTQEEMDAMPGMAPKAAAATEKTAPAVTPAAAAMPQAEMDAMPGISPATPVAPRPPGAAREASDMSGMPGMRNAGASKSKAMGSMPGMAPGGAPAPARMSAPGITILGPPQKWVPPPGDNRAGELRTRDELAEFLQPLPPPVEDAMFHSMTLLEIFEFRANSTGADTFEWDLIGWYGGDTNRLWVKSEGSLDLVSGYDGSGDLQLLYGRMIAPYWDLQAGFRTRFNLSSSLDGNSRTYAVIGLQGLAPGNFDVEPAIYFSDRGEISAELTMSYDLYLTQRLILSPRFRGEVSLQGDDRFDSGEGVNETDIGLRLRYEIRREFAPYIGVSWLKEYGETARLARRQGDGGDSIAFVAGIRFWW